MEEPKQPIVFAFYKDGELKGFRADTFGTLSMKYPKIYMYSKHQVEIVLSNVRAACNKVGSSFLAKIFEIGTVAVNSEGDAFETNAVDHVSRSEQQLRDWNEFEVRVIPFISPEEFYSYSMGSGEEWKKNKVLSELDAPIETHKFRIVENEN